MRYLLSRLGQGIVVLWAAFTATFVILYALPSDPVSIMLAAGGEAAAVDSRLADELRAEYGFDEPLVYQYVHQLGRALTGDLGTSIQTRKPVVTAIAEALPHTLILAGLAFSLALILGIAIAVAASYTHRPWLRQILMALPPVGASVPTFWSGLLLIQVFSFHLGWLPMGGQRGWSSLILPAFTLSLPTAAVIAQVFTKSMLDVWAEPFIDTARGRGVSRPRIQVRHVVRNAVIPMLTMTGVLVGNMLAGSVVVETVFSRVGVGRLTQNAVYYQDIPVVQGLVLLSALIFVVVNLVIDLVYPVIDPRLSRSPSRVVKRRNADVR